MTKKFDNLKNNIKKILLNERDIGYLDPEIDILLYKFNNIYNIVTSSTCIGRIAIVEGRRPWERSGDYHARIIFKSHDKIDIDELNKIINLPSCNLWLKISGIIMHIKTNNINCALYLIKKSREAGFKHSGIISYSEEAGFTVEIMSGAQYMVPVKLDCIKIISSRGFGKIVNHARETLQENRKRLKTFINSVYDDPGPCSLDS